MIEVGPFENGTFDVRLKSSGKLLGVFYMEVDGYYYFHPFEGLSGVWTQESLTEIGNELGKLNEEHNKRLTFISTHKPSITESIDSDIKIDRNGKRKKPQL